MGQVVDFEDGFPVVQFARGRWKGNGGSKKQGFPVGPKPCMWCPALQDIGDRSSIIYLKENWGTLESYLDLKGDRLLALLRLSFARIQSGTQGSSCR